MTYGTGVGSLFAEFLSFGFGTSLGLGLGSLGGLGGSGFGRRFAAGLEFIDTSFYVHDSLFTGEEGVGSGRDMYLNQRIFHAVQNDGLFGTGG